MEGDKLGSEAKSRVYSEGRGDPAFTVASETVSQVLETWSYPPGTRPAPVHLTGLSQLRPAAKATE